MNWTASITLASKLGVAAIFGFTSHVLYFIRGEHHLAAPFLLNLWIAVYISIVGYEIGVSGEKFYSAIWKATLLATSYTLSLFSSMIVYRTFMSPLNSFPGPWLAGKTKLWHMKKSLSSRNHLLMDQLYKQYGDFVRTGPNELTVFAPEILFAVDGKGNNCTKPAWYDLLQPLMALNTMRNKPEHDQRRRIWDRAFSTTGMDLRKRAMILSADSEIEAIRNYEPRCIKYSAQLDNHLQATSGQPILVNDWFYWFSFDVMGDLTMARSFNMLSEKKWHYVIMMMRRFLGMLGPITPVPWLARIGFSVPKATPDWNRFVNWCKKRMDERINMDNDRPDISSWLIQHSMSKETIEEDRRWLEGDAILMIIAGSDTTALSLIYACYHLVVDKSQQEKLRNELRSIASISDTNALRDLPHLKGVIQETLRLHPPVPTGGFRQAGPEGLTVAGTYIPPHTVIAVPKYTIARREDCFERAEEFIPERWYSQPEMVMNKDAYAPFTQGRYSCAGKGLALLELRYVIAMLVSKYDISFASGEDGVRVWKEMKDNFTAVPGKLELVFNLL